MQAQTHLLFLKLNNIPSYFYLFIWVFVKFSKFKRLYGSLYLSKLRESNHFYIYFGRNFNHSPYTLINRKKKHENCYLRVPCPNCFCFVIFCYCFSFFLFDKCYCYKINMFFRNSPVILS